MLGDTLITIVLLIVAEIFLGICVYAFFLFKKEIAQEIGSLPRNLKIIQNLYLGFFALLFFINLVGIKDMSQHVAISDSPLAIFIGVFLVLTSIFIALNIIIMRLLIRYIISTKLNQVDELTHLYNKITGLFKIGEILNEAKSDVYVAMLDIDNFKEVNDIYGHLDGDEVLKLVAGIMKDNTREGDLLSRFGGDEFVICLVDYTEKQAHEVLSKMLLQCNEIGKRYGDAYMSVSIGYAEGTGIKVGGSSTSKSIIYKADIALYNVKKSGKNGIHKFVKDDIKK